MKIIIHGKNMELTPAIRDYVEEKISSISKFIHEPNKDLIEARVEVGKPSLHHHEGEVFYAEVNLKVGKNLMRGTHEHNDLYVAVDKVRDEIERQIKKFKERKIDKARKGLK